MATHSSILAWEIPWTEEPGELQSTGSQRVGHDRVTNTQAHFASDHNYTPAQKCSQVTGSSESDDFKIQLKIK